MKEQTGHPDLDVKIGEPAEYIYFVGCATSFDEKKSKKSG